MQAWARWAGWACGRDQVMSACVSVTQPGSACHGVSLCPGLSTRPHEALAPGRGPHCAGKVLYLLDRILDGQVRGTWESGQGWVVLNHVDLSVSLCPGSFPRTAPRDRVQEHPQFLKEILLAERRRG